MVARFIGDGLDADGAGIVVATRAHRDAFDERLVARGIDVRAARKAGRYVTLDAAETVAELLVDGLPDPGQFDRVVRRRLRRAAGGGRRAVRVFGEMVAVLCATERRDAALALEALWNDALRTMPFSLLCAYPLAAFGHDGDAGAFLRVCGEHTHVIPAEGYSISGSPDEQSRAIAQLQQRALALGVERAEHHLDRARLAAIVDSSHDAIVGKTLEGIVTSWNRAAERLFGYTSAEMVGRPITRIIPPERHDEFRRILAALARGERIEHFETERVRKDGERIQVSLSVSPIRDTTGRIVGAAKIARDVTERRRSEAERERLLTLAERARSEAEAANRVKDEFLAMLSHELRNPLSAIRSAVVSATMDDRQRPQALEIARRQTNQLARLVDDLLDVSRITLGRITLHRAPMSVTELVERAVAMTRPLLETYGHTLAISLPSDVVTVDGDAVRLEQVVLNLLTNAAKYTNPGGRIEIGVAREGEKAVIRVRDNGIGIAPDMLPRVFELFMQVAPGLDRAHGGLGIGLTLVQRLVELHGGRVEAHSEGVGTGTEFVVRLPALPPSASPAASTPLDRRRARGNARVLLVEDNVDAADGLAMLLGILGHEVRVVHDGLTALSTVSAAPPDVMVVDIGLPGMNGYDLARRIRRDPALRNVVLVALTGYGRADDRRQVFDAGFDHYFVKPVDPDALHGLVTRVRAGRSDTPAGTLQ
jgi:PAS domain S-box-containing protein